MLTILIIVFQCINDNFQLLFIPQEISIRSINEECFNIMLFDIVGVGLLQVKQVFVGYGLFIDSLSFLYVFLEFLHRGMKVNQQVRLGNLLVNDFKQFLIKAKLFFGEVYFGKQETFGKQVIGNGKLMEQVLGMYQVL